MQSEKEKEAFKNKMTTKKMSDKKKNLLAKTLAHLVAASAGIRKPSIDYSFKKPGKNHKAWPAKKRRRKIAEASRRRNRKAKV